ncbi:hypothetical protein Ace_0163 [Escherichia coli phage vB_EcoS_Ace]|uniref:Uncharacterized protein n=1 Tax=Escherichia coli phage vB_EcoS_Ace TaxID=2769806 RepID=A0A7H0XBW7_9CAUD|nr:hypothetical protein Ace_0163 [Escherichia coli phage vB_EcoS_Ace]
MLINRPECSEDSRKHPDNKDSYKAKHLIPSQVGEYVPDHYVGSPVTYPY